MARPDQDLSVYLRFNEAAKIGEQAAEVEGETVTLGNGKTVSRAEAALLLAEVYERRENRMRNMQRFLFGAMVPSLSLFILGIAFLWIVRGFRAGAEK